MDRFKKAFVGHLKALRPAFLSTKPHFHFISAHYFYIVGLALIGSIIVYGAGRGEIDYIDALFLASCASTQAGLNTVDINRLNTFQQVILYLWPMMTNPITINTFVVFLRLYWFEKRFQHIAREARLRRGTISKAKTAPKADSADLEQGVNGRKIIVMLNGVRSRITNDGILLEGDAQQPPDEQRPNLASPAATTRQGGAETSDEASEPRRPEIKFARTVTKSDGMGEDPIKLPPVRPDHEHIAFVERQRKGDDEVLRIPNPRDVERGVRPKRVEAGDEEEADVPPRSAAAAERYAEPLGSGADSRQQAITFKEPDRDKLQQYDSDDLVKTPTALRRALSFLKSTWLRSFGRMTGSSQKSEPMPSGGTSRTGIPRRPSLQSIRRTFSRERVEGTPYLSWEPTVGRNSTFLDLTEERREELGGIEYRSLKTLALILTGYFWIFTAIGVIGLAPWIATSRRYGEIVDQAGVSRAWWAFFTANSAFMDLGFTLTPDSMNSFNAAVWPLLLMAFLIVIGNTGFPLMLRFIIWVMSHLAPVGTGLYEELRFLLDHPRRCFTLLFPSGATWWLFWLLVIMNGLDLMFFIVLDLGTDTVVDLPAGLKVLNGLFEAVSTRTAGFSCVDLASLHPAVQFSYMVMMYISVFPIAISVRRTNVYEEQSLGVYSMNDHEEQPGQSDFSYVGSHLRRQLSFDLWYIVLGFFVLNISEGKKIMANDFSAFSVLFEVVSAYGTVGMSLGSPGINASLSARFSVLGKLVIIAMMIRGRHRGLPYGLDRAILLPNETLSACEAADADARMMRIHSHASGATGARGSSLGRRRSATVDSNNFITSLLHPGPAVPPEPFMPELHRARSTEPPSWSTAAPATPATPAAPSADDQETYATRVSSRSPDPAAVSRRPDLTPPAQRPRTASCDD
ncbi:hypothetical protein VTH06DRAFT_3889 [Thermothelomyces fergusii]